MGSTTLLALARFAPGRIALHLLAATGDGAFRFHLLGIAREMNPRALLCVALMVLSSSVAIASGRDVSARPVVLVASQAGAAALGESVVLAVPLGNGSHFGFVLNQPTDTPLSEVLPEEERSRTVRSLVHVGGPVLGAAVFAIVRGARPASRPLYPITNELSVALDTEAVDGVIEKRAGDARFFMGMMLWMPGALADEVTAGAWQVFPADTEVVMSRNPAFLWPRLAERAAYRPTSLQLDLEPRPCPKHSTH
jgi:putative transcriptional regulator